MLPDVHERVFDILENHNLKELLVRGHNAERCRTLKSLGANLVVSENLEASLGLAREALILRFRHEHYAGVEREDPDQAQV